MASPAGTNFNAAVNSTLKVAFTDDDGLAVRAFCTGTPPTTSGTFAHGCILTQTDSTTGQRANFENVGSSTSVSWRFIGTYGSTTYITAAVDTTSTASASATTPASLFPGGAPAAATITYVQLIQKNATAGVVELASTTNTKAFVIKNVTASSNVVMGATSILNASVAAGEDIKVVSTTAGASATIVVGLTINNY